MRAVPEKREIEEKEKIIADTLKKVSEAKKRREQLTALGGQMRQAQAESIQHESPQRKLPWRDILGAAILLLCVGTFAWAVNSLLQFFS
jgi:hypothetical protein|tara:strand:- start:315 stop:581 length:267 start_codon:yes stop_codon:yes gene_type:complete